MLNIFWRIIAKVIARPAIAEWLIARAKLTPYQHIMPDDGSEMYMGRWWLLNPYCRETHKPALWWCPWSFRILRIMRPDEDRDLHDHPWNARTITLRGWYREQRLFQPRMDRPKYAHLAGYAENYKGQMDAIGYSEDIDCFRGD